MALRLTIQRECNLRNKKGRHVEKIPALSEDDFWQMSKTGDFLISGGQDEQIQAILSYIRVTMNNSPKPIIIFDGTGGLEDTLIKAYSSGKEGISGGLTVYSPQFQGYDVFRGLDTYTVFQFLKEATSDRSWGNEIDSTYIEAFLEVANAIAPITLEKLRQLAEKTDEQILAIAQDAGVSQQYLNLLSNPGYDAKNFRSFFYEIENAFSNIHNRNSDTGNNILNDIQSNGVIYINAQSSNQYLFNVYICMILEFISKRKRCLFDIMLYEIIPREKDGLINHIKHSMLESNETVGLCFINMRSFVEQYPFITDMPRHVIYTNDRNLIPSAILESYGKYDHYYPQRKYGSDIVRDLLAPDWELAMEKRDRVRVEDLDENGTVSKIMKGYRGLEVALVQNI